MSLSQGLLFGSVSLRASSVIGAGYDLSMEVLEDEVLNCCFPCCCVVAFSSYLVVVLPTVVSVLVPLLARALANSGKLYTWSHPGGKSLSGDILSV